MVQLGVQTFAMINFQRNLRDALSFFVRVCAFLIITRTERALSNGEPRVRVIKDFSRVPPQPWCQLFYGGMQPDEPNKEKYKKVESSIPVRPPRAYAESVFNRFVDVSRIQYIYATCGGF